MAEDTSRQHMLTTVDNPFNPFTQFDEWFAWDTAAGYHTLGLLARVAIYSTEMSETDQALAIHRAIDEILEENISGMHRLVTQGPDD